MQATDHHPSRDDLGRLARAGEPGALANSDAHIHLLAGCPRCAADFRQAVLGEAPALRRLIGDIFLGDGDPQRDDFVELADRTAAWSTVIDAEQAAAPELEEALLALPSDERLEAVRTGNRYRFLGLVYHLIERAREEILPDPSRSRALAELAVEASESIPDDAYPPQLLAEARALAWATFGNALRVCSDLFGAERAFRSAGTHLGGDLAHPVVEAEVLSLLGSLRLVQTRYAEAMEIFLEAVEVFRAFDEITAVAKAVMKMAKAAGEAGETEEAVTLLERAEAMLDPVEDRALLLHVRHARVVWLTDAGRSQAAAELYARLRPDYEAEFGDFVSVQRLAWLGARLLWSQGETQSAERELLEVRSRFEERDEAYDFALVTLDLAMLYLEQGRTAEVRQLAEEMIPIFTSRRIHQHALAALVLFQRAADAETATVSFVRDLTNFLDRARQNPYLTYENHA